MKRAIEVITGSIISLVGLILPTFAFLFVGVILYIAVSGTFTEIFPSIGVFVGDVWTGRTKLGWSSDRETWMMILSIPICVIVLFCTMITLPMMERNGFRSLWNGSIWREGEQNDSIES